MGVASAKAIAFAADIPIVSVNHMHGHISANFIAYPELEPPFMCLIVSGGHTNICLLYTSLLLLYKEVAFFGRF